MKGGFKKKSFYLEWILFVKGRMSNRIACKLNHFKGLHEFLTSNYIIDFLLKSISSDIGATFVRYKNFSIFLC